MYDASNDKNNAIRKQFCSLPKLVFIAEAAQKKRQNNNQKHSQQNKQTRIHSQLRQLREKQLQIHNFRKQLNQKKKSISYGYRHIFNQVKVRKKNSLNSYFHPIKIDNLSFCKKKMVEYQQYLTYQKQRVKIQKKQAINKIDRQYLVRSNLSHNDHKQSRFQLILSNRSIVISENKAKIKTQPQAQRINYSLNTKKINKFTSELIQEKIKTKTKHEFSPWQGINTQDNQFNGL